MIFDNDWKQIRMARKEKEHAEEHREYRKRLAYARIGRQIQSAHQMRDRERDQAK